MADAGFTGFMYAASKDVLAGNDYEFIRIATVFEPNGPSLDSEDGATTSVG